MSSKEEVQEVVDVGDESDDSMEEENDVDMDEIEPKEEKIDPETTDDKTLSKKKGKGASSKNFAVHISNLPFLSTEDEIRKHFQQFNDDINKVILFKFPSGKFKGNCLIEFNTKGSQEKVLKMNNKAEIGGRTLEINPGKKLPRNNLTKYELELQRKKASVVRSWRKGKQSKWKIKRLPSKMKAMNKK